MDKNKKRASRTADPPLCLLLPSFKKLLPASHLDNHLKTPISISNSTVARSPCSNSALPDTFAYMNIWQSVLHSAKFKQLITNRKIRFLKYHFLAILYVNNTEQVSNRCCILKLYSSKYHFVSIRDHVPYSGICLLENVISNLFII